VKNGSTAVGLVLLGVGGLIGLRMFHVWEVRRAALPLAAQYCDAKTPALSRKLSAGVDLKMAKWSREQTSGLFNRSAQRSASQRIQVIERAIELAEAQGCFRTSFVQP